MNNGISQIGQQLMALWKQLGLNQRVVVAGSGLAVLAAVIGLLTWSSRTDYALLYGRLPEAEAAKVVAALDDAKVPYKIARSGGSISVPADKVYLMRMQLAAKGIPHAGDGVGFEIFDKPNFGISDFVQRANYLRAVQGELGRTISQVDSIETARVMIVMPDNRLLTDSNKRPTSSVFVRVRGNATLPPQTVNAIRFLVANAVEGLSVNYVSVVDNMGNVLSENADENSLVGLTTTQLQARKNFEQYLTKKAEGMLDTVLGPGQAVVRVSADINYDTLTRTEEKFDPEGQVLRTSTSNDENTDTIAANQSSSGGAPGAASNSSVETNVLSVMPTSKSNTRKKVTNTQYEINKVQSNLVSAAGGLRHLSAAVFVAMRFEGSGTTRKALPRTKDELDRLRRIVQSTLGAQEIDTRKDEVTLEEIAFNDQPAMEINKQLEKQQKTELVVDSVRTFAFPVMGVVMLGLFYRAWKKTPSESIPIGIPLGGLAYANGFANGHGNGNGNGNGHSNGHTNGKTNGNGNGNGKSNNGGLHGAGEVVTVEVLNQVVRENPDNITQAIRQWMSRGKSK